MKYLFLTLALFMSHSHASEVPVYSEEEILEQSDVVFLGKFVRDNTPAIVFNLDRPAGEESIFPIEMIFPGFRFEVVWNIKNARRKFQEVYLVSNEPIVSLAPHAFIESRALWGVTSLEDPNYQNLFLVAGYIHDDQKFGGWPLMDGKIIGNADYGGFYVVPRNEEREVRALWREALRNVRNRRRNR